MQQGTCTIPPRRIGAALANVVVFVALGCTVLPPIVCAETFWPRQGAYEVNIPDGWKKIDEDTLAVEFGARMGLLKERNLDVPIVRWDAGLQPTSSTSPFEGPHILVSYLKTDTQAVHRALLDPLERNALARTLSGTVPEARVVGECRYDSQHHLASFGDVEVMVDGQAWRTRAWCKLGRRGMVNVTLQTKASDMEDWAHAGRGVAEGVRFAWGATFSPASKPSGRPWWHYAISAAFMGLCIGTIQLVRDRRARAKSKDTV